MSTIMGLLSEETSEADVEAVCAAWGSTFPADAFIVIEDDRHLFHESGLPLIDFGADW